MWEVLLPTLRKAALWVCVGLWGAFMVLLVWFYHYRLTVAQERLQAVSRELIAVEDQFTQFKEEQVSLSKINAKAGKARTDSKESTHAASTKAAAVGTTRLSDAEYNVVLQRANEVRSTALHSSARASSTNSPSDAR